jgi:hypothetical protein
VKFWEKRSMLVICNLYIYIFLFFYFFILFFCMGDKTKCEEEIGQSKIKFHQEELGK